MNDILKKISEGGEWWKKLPERKKPNEDFNAIYLIINLLEDK